MRGRLRMGCSSRTRGRLRVSRRGRLRSSLRMSRRFWLRSRLRMSCSRLGLAGWTSLLGLCRLVLVRARRSRFVLSRLVLVRTSRGCFVLSCLVLTRARCSCLILRSLAFGRLTLSGLVLRSLVFGRLTLSGLVLGGLVLGGRSLVRCSRLFRRYHPRTAKLAGLRGRCDCGPPLVHGRQKRVVGAGSVHMLALHRSCRRVLLVHRSLFHGGRSGGNSTLAAVVADMVHRGFVNYGLAVNIGDVRDVHVIHRAVVVETSVVPISAPIADTTVAKAVVDATVEADTLAPVTFIPCKGIVAPAPIAGSPEQANGRRLDPCAGNPEVAFITVRPVARCPQITGCGDHGLSVYRQRGRSDRDRHAELRERDSWYHHEQNCEQQKTGDTHSNHLARSSFDCPMHLLLRAARS